MFFFFNILVLPLSELGVMKRPQGHFNTGISELILEEEVTKYDEL